MLALQTTPPVSTPAPSAAPPMSDSQLTDLADKIQQATGLDANALNLPDLPWAAYLIPLGVLVAGLVLWAAGRKVLKPITVAVFGLVGATIGYVIIGPMPAAANLAPLWVWTLGLTAVGLIVGSLLFRFAMGLGLGLTLACVGVLVAAIVPGPPENLPPKDPVAAALSTNTHAIDRLRAEGLALRDRLRARLNEAQLALAAPGAAKPDGRPADGSVWTPAAPSDPAREFVNDAQQKASAFASALWEEGKGAWNMRSPTQRLAMMIAAGVGFILGTWLGVGVPKWAAGAVTALAGAALWLSAGAWLVTSAGLPGAERVEAFTAGQWLVIWGVVALIGVGVQWSGLAGGRKKKKVVPVVEA